MRLMSEEQAAKLSAKNRAARRKTANPAWGKVHVYAPGVGFGDDSLDRSIEIAAKPAGRTPRAASRGEAELAMQLRASRIYGWQCEYRFSEARKWRLDFAWPDRLLAVEIEGGSWTGGRHTTGTGFEADAIKYNAAALAGWRLLRYTPAMVGSGEALAQIKIALAL